MVRTAESRRLPSFHPSYLTAGEKLVVLLVCSCGCAFLAAALAVVLLDLTDISTAVELMFATVVGFLTLISLLLALLFAAVWGYRP